MAFIDLNLKLPKCHTPSSTRKEMTNEFWKNHFLADHGFLTHLRIPTMRRTVPRKLQNQILLLLGSISLPGFCPTYLLRKSPRYPGLSTRRPDETLPHGHPEEGFPQYLSADMFKRQRNIIQYITSLVTNLGGYARPRFSSQCSGTSPSHGTPVAL